MYRLRQRFTILAPTFETNNIVKAYNMSRLNIVNDFIFS